MHGHLNVKISLIIINCIIDVTKKKNKHYSIFGDFIRLDVLSSNSIKRKKYTHIVWIALPWKTLERLWFESNSHAD